VVPPRQLPLALPHEAALDRADFLEGAANIEAVTLVDRWPDWPARPVLLVGPPGSGKSHLIGIWRQASGARIAKASDLTAADAEALVASGAVGIEDLQDGPIDEAALFHLLNLAAVQKAAVMLTSRVPGPQIPLALPDLMSRLRAALPVTLSAPDDDLLRRVLIKLFADRQLTVERGVVDYIVARMERSFDAANRIVAALDHEALARGRSITTRLAGELLGSDGEADEPE